jgi:putative alpha-1,2-mannosidase
MSNYWKIPIILLYAMSSHSQSALETIQHYPLKYVNPLTGTRNMGHTYPGATAPFGMVQLSPDTRLVPLLKDNKYNPETYRYCSGYQYEDTTIFGFSHTHFSGTGHSDLGDFLIMPTMGDLVLEPGNPGKPRKGSGWSTHRKKISTSARPC